MEWYELRPIINAVVGMVAFTLFWGVCFCMRHRWKLNFNNLLHEFRKPRVFIPLGIAWFCVLFGALSFKTFISEKYDFRGKWDAYQFRKTMIDDEAFQKPIDKNIAEIGE